MPPPKRDRPPVAETEKVLVWCKTALATEAKARRGNERTCLRRLNRLEYENTVHDLLDVDVPLQAMLPVDDRVEGFDTATQALTISPVHIQRYMEAAEVALQAAIVRGSKPKTVTTRFSYDHPKESSFYNQGKFGSMMMRREGELLFFAEANHEHPAFLHQFSDLTRR